jgi:hypothetical protein
MGLTRGLHEAPAGASAPIGTTATGTDPGSTTDLDTLRSVTDRVRRNVERVIEG